MKEDIEILKAFRNYNKFYKEETNELFIAIDLNAKTELDKAIENLLTRYKQLEEENKTLKEQVTMSDEAYSGAIKESKKWFDKAHDSIPKSKVKELKEKVHDGLDKNGITRAYQIFIDGYFDEVLGG